MCHRSAARNVELPARVDFDGKVTRGTFSDRVHPTRPPDASAAGMSRARLSRCTTNTVARGAPTCPACNRGEARLESCCRPCHEACAMHTPCAPPQLRLSAYRRGDVSQAWASEEHRRKLCRAPTDAGYRVRFPGVEAGPSAGRYESACKFALRGPIGFNPETPLNLRAQHTTGLSL
jgi:hypothetical protein